MGRQLWTPDLAHKVVTEEHDHDGLVCNHRLTHKLGVCSEEIERRMAAVENKGQSVIVVGHRPHNDCKGEVLGILAVGDPVRPNAAAATLLGGRD